MSTLGPEARALVDAGRSSLRPTDADRERVLGALLARIPASDVAGDSATGATTGGDPAVSGDAAVQTTAGKGVGWLVLSGAVVGLGVVGALLLWQPKRTETLPPAAPALPATRVVEAPPEVVQVPTEAKGASPSGSAVAPEPARATNGASGATSRAPSDRLAEEVAILSRAETELHAGRFAGALAALDEHQRKFPRGVLSQERVAVRIHALCGLGRIAEAETAFRALNRLSPLSPHEGRARAACSANQPKQ